MGANIAVLVGKPEQQHPVAWVQYSSDAMPIGSSGRQWVPSWSASRSS